VKKEKRAFYEKNIPAQEKEKIKKTRIFKKNEY